MALNNWYQRVITPLFGHTGSVGSLLSTMGCAACFPAAGSIGASLGLGFLAAFEGAFINYLLPLFALIALISQASNFLAHRHIFRLLLSISGPLMVLSTLYLFWTDNWSTNLLYAGLILMLLVSLLDIFKPAVKVCPTGA